MEPPQRGRSADLLGEARRKAGHHVEHGTGFALSWQADLYSVAQGRRPAVEINCPNCGTENWLENQSTCFHCSTILRRCVDCTSYERTSHRCTSLDTDIDLHEAEQPSLLATSTNCSSYRRFGQAA
jgi:hypothetical protein